MASFPMVSQFFITSTNLSDYDSKNYFFIWHFDNPKVISGYAHHLRNTGLQMIIQTTVQCGVPPLGSNPTLPS